MEANLAPDTVDLDLDLQERVIDAINALDVLRGTRAHVRVLVSNGQVTLEGNLQSPMAAAEAARTVAEVPGATTFTNHLMDDATLSRQIAGTLATDARTSAIPPGYEVAPKYGHVALIGYFTPEQAQAVEAVSRGVAGVRSVRVRVL